jgi:hypothetical protein
LGKRSNSSDGQGVARAKSERVVALHYEKEQATATRKQFVAKLSLPVLQPVTGQGKSRIDRYTATAALSNSTQRPSTTRKVGPIRV